MGSPLKLSEEWAVDIVDFANNLFDVTKASYESPGHEFSPIAIAEVSRGEFLHGVKMGLMIMGVDSKIIDDVYDNFEFYKNVDK